jgi:periplasmic copper chaperone A
MPPMKLTVLLCCGLLPAMLSIPLLAQSVSVDHAWVRSTVAAQTATGAFMDITSHAAAVLTGVSSPVAGTVEMHEMRMEGNVMKMRALDKLELPAGKTVKFTPGSYHLMLLELKRPLQAGDMVPLTLVLEAGDGKRTKVEIKAEVRKP